MSLNNTTSAIHRLLKPVIAVFFLIAFGTFATYYILYNQNYFIRSDFPKPGLFHISNNVEKNTVTNLCKITSKGAFLLYQKRMKQMSGRYYEVKTLNTTPVSYDTSESFPKRIDGTPKWEPTTYEEFNYWLPKSTYYVGFGTWIGVTLFYGTQLVKKAVGFEGDPSAYANVYTNLEGNSHRDWYNHTNVYPVAVRAGHNDTGAKKVSMRSGGAGNSCSGMKEILTRKDGACGNDMNKDSWDIDGYTMPYLLSVNGIPASKETFIKIDVESYECELIPSWFEWLKELTEKPTLFVSFHGHNVRCCTKDQYDQILSFSKLYKGFWHNMKKANAEDFFNVATCTTEVVVFSDLQDKELV